ncbi:MAG: NUDIX domain-containing protein [Chloroflexi bacterium]|nr:NUDIX domain-containing protein [Chloroflexota bacterium]
MNTLTVRAAVVLTVDGNIALIRRERDEQTYFVFPGGKLDEGESPSEAAVREAKEELGLDVQVEQLVAQLWFAAKWQYYFTARIIGGKFGTGSGDEVRGLYPPERGTYTPAWMPVAELLANDVRPRSVAELVVAAARDGWATETTRRLAR